MTLQISLKYEIKNTYENIRIPLIPPNMKLKIHILASRHMPISSGYKHKLFMKVLVYVCIVIFYSKIGSFGFVEMNIYNLKKYLHNVEKKCAFI